MFKSPKTLTSCRRDIIDIYKYGVEAVRPDHLIKKALSIEGDSLIIENAAKAKIRINIHNTRMHVIGGGKSAFGMACGIANLAKSNHVTGIFSRGLLSIPVGLKEPITKDPNALDNLRSIGVECMYGSRNNLPDKDSIAASCKILDEIKIACDEDELNGVRPLFIVLISGGGSACLAKPKYIDIETKLELIRILVQRGASIIELNAVRRYLSSIKGGQLASHILSCHEGARILTLIMSDVIGDPIEFIASGPTYLVPRGIIHDEFLNVLRKYQISHHGYLFETGNSSNDHQSLPSNEAIANIVIGNNSIAIDAAKARALALGYAVRNLGPSLQGNTDSIVKLLRSSGDEFSPDGIGKLLVIGGGEATVEKLPGESWGLGGRNQEMALDYMLSVLDNPVDSDSIDILLAGTTDGQDGPTDVAACLASYSELKSSNLELKLDHSSFRVAKQSHDSYNFWTRCKTDWLIKTGLTGTNVMDLYIYMLVKNRCLHKL